MNCSRKTRHYREGDCLNSSSLFVCLNRLLVECGLAEIHVLALLGHFCKGISALRHGVCLGKWSLSLTTTLDRHIFVLLDILRQGHFLISILTTTKGRLEDILLLVAVLLIALWHSIGHWTRNRLILLTIHFLESASHLKLLISLGPVEIRWLLDAGLVLVSEVGRRLRCESHGFTLRQRHRRLS